eukprot:m.359433 g.359433  ORF g.359433 m.359433 type:complete len:164 (+) comp18559_c0_seq1:375-866(+)
MASFEEQPPKLEAQNTTQFAEEQTTSSSLRLGEHEVALDEETRKQRSKWVCTDPSGHKPRLETWDACYIWTCFCLNPFVFVETMFGFCWTRNFMHFHCRRCGLRCPEKRLAWSVPTAPFRCMGCCIPSEVQQYYDFMHKINSADLTAETAASAVAQEEAHKMD